MATLLQCEERGSNARNECNLVTIHTAARIGLQPLCCTRSRERLGDAYTAAASLSQGLHIVRVAGGRNLS